MSVASLTLYSQANYVRIYVECSKRMLSIVFCVAYLSTVVLSLEELVLIFAQNYPQVITATYVHGSDFGGKG